MTTQSNAAEQRAAELHAHKRAVLQRRLQSIARQYRLPPMPRGALYGLVDRLMHVRGGLTDLDLRSVYGLTCRGLFDGRDNG